MDYQVVPGKELTIEQCDAWSALQQADAALDSPYHRPEFTQAVAAVRDDVFVGVVRDRHEYVAFLPFERKRFGRGKPVGGTLSGCQALIARRGLQYDPAKLVCHFGLRVMDFDHLITAQPAFKPFHMARESAPYVDLSRGFEAYCAQRRQAGSDRVRKLQSQARKLDREHGPLQFNFHSNRRDALEALLAWKSDQFRETGFADIFRYGWTVRLLERLLDHPTGRM